MRTFLAYRRALFPLTPQPVPCRCSIGRLYHIQVEVSDGEIRLDKFLKFKFQMPQALIERIVLERQVSNSISRRRSIDETFYSHSSLKYLNLIKLGCFDRVYLNPDSLAFPLHREPAATRALPPHSRRHRASFQTGRSFFSR